MPTNIKLTPEEDVDLHLNDDAETILEREVEKDKIRDEILQEFKDDEAAKA